MDADPGEDRGEGSAFYYNNGSQRGGYTPTDSLGPGAVTVRKDDTSAGVQEDFINVAGVDLISIGGRLIQTTSG